MSTKHTILKAADRLFARDGYAATGVAALANEAGVTKRTLYKHFGSKDGLFLAWLEMRNKSSLALVMSAAEEMGETPRERLLAVFDVLAKFSKVKTFYGCPFSRTLIELAGHPDHKAFIASEAHKRAVSDWFEIQVRQLAVPDSDQLLEQLCVLYEGVLMRTLTTRSSLPAESAKQMAGNLLGGNLSD